MSLTSAVLSIAKGEVGYHEGRSADGHWNNKEKYAEELPGMSWADFQAWCATFVSWVAWKAGADALFPKTASCATGVQWFKAKGRFSEYPAIGAQVFYGPGGGTHTGIVYDFDADYVYTVEGNTNDNGSAEGDGVYLKKRERRSTFVYGYGYPLYPEGIKSADPKFPAPAPAPAPVPAPPAPKPVPVPPKPAPPKPAPKPVYVPPAFPAGIRPNSASPSAKPLQRALKAAGFMPASVVLADNYGPATQKAVHAFFGKFPQFAEKGVAYDVSIGPKGWAFLFTLAYKK